MTPHSSCNLDWAQVQLYAELQPGALLPFLAASQSYSLEPALAVCERHGLVPEQVHKFLSSNEGKGCHQSVVSRTISRVQQFQIAGNTSVPWLL
jgi:hypothetical protein